MVKLARYWNSLTGYRALIIFLLVTVFANLIQFPHGGIDEWKAIRQKDTQSILDTDNLKGRYGPFVFMRNNSTGSTFYLPAHPRSHTQNITLKDSFSQRAVGIARLDTLKFRDYDQAAILAFLDKKNPSFEDNYNREVGRTWKRDYFKVYAGSNNVKEWIYVADGKTDLYIDISILEEKLLKGLHS